MTSTVLQRLENLLSLAEEKLEAREEYYDNKSEKWLNSEAGESYLEKTEYLETYKESLEEAVNSLTSFLE